jgi:ATP-dependent RNA helicase DeaD
MTDADPAPGVDPAADATAVPVTPRSPDAEADPASFAALGLAPALLETLAGLGYEEPTPVQEAAIPPLLAGRDLLAEAPTGTGKTAAFALPIIQRLAARGILGRAGEGRTLALVLVPTRELAMQVAEAVHRYGRAVDAHVLPIYGGQAIGQQLRALRRGVDVVVATPGRAIDHLTRGSLSFDKVEAVVLDEADEMLDMGFAEDLETLLSATPAGRQTALFSATISPTIARIAARHLREPVRVAVRPERPSSDEAPRVRQRAYVVRGPDKLAALARILDLEDPASALVFARTRVEVDELAEALAGRGHDAAALHGGMSQEQRDRVMGRFREGTLDVLVATDVAARGLDIEHVSHVVNFDIPSDPDMYTHRIGRTGRMGREGVAITLVEPREHRLLHNIETASRMKLELATIPTVADLRERRFEMLQGGLRERLLEEGLDRYRGVVEPLADEFDLVEIALAAVSLLDGANARDVEEVEIAAASLPPDRPLRQVARPGRSGPAPAPRGPGGRGSPSRPGGWPPASAASRQDGREAAQGPVATGRRASGPWVRLYVGGGRRAGMRPGDLVGAITNEAGVPGSDIGAIQIADSFSLVDVAEGAADRVVAALRGATIRGRTFAVHRDRDA